MKVDDALVMRQITDGQIDVPIDEIAGWPSDKQRTYYLTLEKRVIGTNILLDHMGIPPWEFGHPETDVQRAYERTINRWNDVVKAMVFEDANELANSARDRRDAIRKSVAEKVAQAESAAA